jgi:two-component system sensor histidine kinase KdpD
LFVVALAGMTAGAVFLLAWLVTGDDRRAQTWHAVVPLVVLLLAVVLLNRRWREQEDSTQRLADQNEQLRAVDKAKSDFLANVSHDLRTPLANVQMLLSGLLDTNSAVLTPEQIRETVHLASQEVEQLGLRVHNLLEMSRIEARAYPLHRQPCDLTDLVGGALERLESALRERPMDARFPPEPLLVECDPDQIESVIVNLLENALKYSPPGSPLHLRGWRRGHSVLFALRDEGPGIFPGDEKRVFQKFYRAAGARALAGGTGLGLAICKALVGSHGGDIRVHNVAGGGAEFVFSLPALGPNGEALLPMGTVTAAPAAAAAMADTEAWR